MSVSWASEMCIRDSHKAMGDYSAAASLGNTAAQMALDHAVDIDDFYNRDLYNP